MRLDWLRLDGVRLDWLRLDRIRLEWLLSPIGLFSLLALGLFGCLALFLSMKREIALARRSVAENKDLAAVSVTTLTAELAAFRKQMEESGAAAPLGQELNLTRRAQALRMQNRGESAATIASALQLPRNEIDLLLKIQKLTAVAKASQTA
jgi:hypothetical protein